MSNFLRILIALRSLPRNINPKGIAGSLLLAAALLTACGGGDGSESEEDPVEASESSVDTAPPSEAATSKPETQTGAQAPVASSGPAVLNASTSCGISGFQAELLRQINAARASERQCGSATMPAVAPLAWNTRLFSAAARHSRDMAQNNYFSHTSLDGRSMGQRVRDEGYAWSAVGENIAAGQGSVDAVMSGWLSSPGHCTNIMRSAYTHVAVSCVQRSGTTYGRYWTMVLAKP